MRLRPTLAAVCMLSLPLSGGAQAASFDETAHRAPLERLLNAGADTERFLSRFERVDRCRYTLTFGQQLDGGAYRAGVTPVDFSALSPDESWQTYYDIGVGEVKLKLRAEAPDVTTALTLTDPEGTQRQAHIDTFGATCADDTCTMDAPSRDVAFVVLGPDAQVKTEQVYLALLGMVNACAAPDDDAPADEGN